VPSTHTLNRIEYTRMVCPLQEKLPFGVDFEKGAFLSVPKPSDRAWSAIYGQAKPYRIWLDSPNRTSIIRVISETVRASWSGPIHDMVPRSYP